MAANKKFDARASLMIPRVQAGTKKRQIEMAKSFQGIVEERAKRTGVAAPPYEFLEYIGRGSFGRVYKSKHRETGIIVAVKITEVDSPDYKAYFEDKDRSLPDLIKEIEILQQLKQSKATDYVNIIYDAFPMYSELWMVSEYCPGGSITTLMKAAPKQGLEERYIIAIARELATALKYVHEAGVIHRDVKCGNVLITEDGRVQLCDFGVSGVLENDISKRSTIVGTLHWMPPELLEANLSSNYTRFPVAPLYRHEIDIWAFGCTVYEMAMGHGPMSTIRSLPEMVAFSQENPPRLEGDQFSDKLKSLVQFCTEVKPENRPSASAILQHDCIRDTAEKYPTGSLIELVQRYVQWETQGGARVSLFNPQMGAAAPEAPIPLQDDDEDWTFSTSDNMDEHDWDFELEPPGTGYSASSDATLRPGTAASGTLNTSFAMPRSNQPRESMVRRGAGALGRLFDPGAAPYNYGETSDLSLRQQWGEGGNTRESIIDLDDIGGPPFGLPAIELGDVPTLRANRLNSEELDRVLRQFKQEEEEKAAEEARLERQNAYQSNQDSGPRRATRDWKFPTMGASEPTNIMNRRTQDWTFASAIAEADPGDQPPMPQNRYTKDLQSQTLTVPSVDGYNNRRTQDFKFPAAAADFGGPSDDDGTIDLNIASPDEFRPQLRHAATAPYGSFDNMYSDSSAANSPPRTSMIDLDFAMPGDEYVSRPRTSNSEGQDVHPNSNESAQADPFDLEDQFALSENSSRLSYHTKSQSEPTQAVVGLLTPNERLSGSNQDGKTGHNRGSSQSNATIKPVIPRSPSQGAPFSRRHQRRYPRRDHSLSARSTASLSETDPDTDAEYDPARGPPDSEWWQQFTPGNPEWEDRDLMAKALALGNPITTGPYANYLPMTSRSSSFDSRPAGDGEGEYYSESDTPSGGGSGNTSSNALGHPPGSLSFSAASGNAGANGATSTLSTAPPRTSIRAPPSAFASGVRPVVDWPVPAGVDPEALTLDAEAGLVRGEMERLFDEIVGICGVARGVLGERN